MQDFFQEEAYVGLKLFSILSLLLILSECRRQDQASHPGVLVMYRFDGPADDIYATLVARLHHTVAFQSTDLWKAADFNQSQRD